MPRIAIVFAAGFLAVLLGHQPTVAALNALGIAPAGFTPYSLDPVPPLGVPSVISKAFWGGLWAIVLNLVLARSTGLTYWLGWIILGAVALSLVAIFVVAAAQGSAGPRVFRALPLCGSRQRRLGSRHGAAAQFVGPALTQTSFCDVFSIVCLTRCAEQGTFGRMSISRGKK